MTRISPTAPAPALTPDSPQGLVLGFGALTVDEARRGARVIVDVLRQGSSGVRLGLS